MLVDKGAAYPVFLYVGQAGSVAQGADGERQTARIRSAVSLSEKKNSQRAKRRVTNTSSGSRCRWRETRFYDGLRGDIVIDNATIDDQVLLKSDGFPTLSPGQRRRRSPDTSQPM